MTTKVDGSHHDESYCGEETTSSRGKPAADTTATCPDEESITVVEENDRTKASLTTGSGSAASQDEAEKEEVCEEETVEDGVDNDDDATNYFVVVPDDVDDAQKSRNNSNINPNKLSSMLLQAETTTTTTSPITIREPIITIHHSSGIKTDPQSHQEPITQEPHNNPSTFRYSPKARRLPVQPPATVQVPTKRANNYDNNNNNNNNNITPTYYTGEDASTCVSSVTLPPHLQPVVYPTLLDESHDDLPLIEPESFPNNQTTTTSSQPESSRPQQAAQDLQNEIAAKIRLRGGNSTNASSVSSAPASHQSLSLQSLQEEMADKIRIRNDHSNNNAISYPQLTGNKAATEGTDPSSSLSDSVAKDAIQTANDDNTNKLPSETKQGTRVPGLEADIPNPAARPSSSSRPGAFFVAPLPAESEGDGDTTNLEHPNDDDDDDDDELPNVTAVDTCDEEERNYASTRSLSDDVSNPLLVDEAPSYYHLQNNESQVDRSDRDNDDDENHVRPQHLAQASLVQNPVDPENLQVAQQVVMDTEQTDPMDNPTKSSFSKLFKRRRTIRAVLIGCLWVILLGIVVGVVISTQVYTDDKEVAPMEEHPREDVANVIRSQIPSVGNDDAYDQALQWLLHEDPLQLTTEDPNLQQRFILVHFYFSTTQGDAVWTSCNPPRGSSDRVDRKQEPPETVRNDTTSDRHSLCYYQENIALGLLFSEDMQAYNLYAHSQYRETLAHKWLSDQHECQWAGIFCSSNKQVEHIHLDSMNLTGTLPSNVFQLPELQLLYVPSNRLRGKIPNLLYSLPNLTLLDLEKNELSGTISEDWWQKFPALKHLKLSGNPLELGTLPTSIQHLVNLKYLYLDNVGITGIVPNQLYKLTNLDTLFLSMNSITGTLSSQLGLLTKLSFLNFFGNTLSGSLPSEMAKLTKLSEVTFWENNLQGTIPEEIYLANYSALNALIFGDNRLNGTISTNIGKLSTLGYLMWQGNQLSGSVPTEMGLLTKLARVDLDDNKLTGSIPEELCDLRGDNFLERLSADCEPFDSGIDTDRNETIITPVFCPLGCCTKCCNQNTGICQKFES